MRYTWNQKNLDYEIETAAARISGSPSVPTWNQKNLDYEIETEQTARVVVYRYPLETKRTSITRLKHV